METAKDRALGARVRAALTAITFFGTLLPALVFGMITAAAASGEPRAEPEVESTIVSARQAPLTFDERVALEETIQRTYYRHRVGRVRPFDEIVSHDTLERRVWDYLERRVILEEVWGRLIAAGSLRAETERIVRQTRMPDRLAELFAALGNDPVRVQEGLVLPALVRRLSQKLFDHDSRIHAEARDEIENLRLQLEVGNLDPRQAHSRRAELELPREALPGTADEAMLRVVGEVGAIQESRDGFSFQVLLETRDSSSRFAVFRVPKRGWRDWVDEIAPSFNANVIPIVADDTVPLSAPAPAAAPFTSSREGLMATCTAGLDDVWNNGSLDDLPQTEFGSAVWTGSEVIVWGGRMDEGTSTSGWIDRVVNTGGRYDPLLDTWSLVSMNGAPEPRFLHTAIWTGTEMIVWGGFDDKRLATGGRYDPTTDTWQLTSLVGAPAARHGHTAVWTGSEMIVWGGSVGNPGAPTGGGRYDPVLDRWSSTSSDSAPSLRSRHTAVWTGEKMVVWGGVPDPSQSSVYLESGGVYDPASDTWTATSAIFAPTARADHTAVWTGTEMIIWGGKNSDHFWLANGARYNEQTDEWSAMATEGAGPRTHHSAVWTGSEMLVVGYAFSSGNRYDPATDSWQPMTAINSPPRGVYKPPGVWTGTEWFVWARGGFRYNPAQGVWARVPGPNEVEGRLTHTAVWTGNEMIIWGGRWSDTNPNGFGLGSGARYDPTLDSWTPTASTGAPTPRGLHSGVWTGSEMIIWGGIGVGASGTGARYDPLVDEWTAVSNEGVPTGRRFDDTVVWTGTEMIVWGGYGDNAPLDTGVRYDPVSDTWTATSTSGAPSPRSNHTAVWTGTEMVIWGGLETPSTPVNTGGRYDPVTDSWVATPLLDAPVSRRSHSAVWTGTEMIVWGGLQTITGAHFDPVVNSWSPTTIVSSSDERLHHTAVWTGAEMILWGGGNSTVSRYNPSTRNWMTSLDPDRPRARTRHTAVWTGESMIVWGGQPNSTPSTSQLPGLYTGGIYYATLDRDGDGATDSCDCAPDDGAAFRMPWRVANLRFSSDNTSLEWDSDAPNSGSGTGYDIMRGEVSALPVGNGATEACVESQSVGPTTETTVEPPEGTVFYYVVRPRNRCGVGSYGESSDGVERATVACP